MLPTYPNIDMKLTGKRIKQIVDQSGYSVKQIQEYLQLSCPQPVYRWFKGIALPSINHMYALGLLLGVSVDTMIVPQSTGISMQNTDSSKDVERILLYYQKISDAA